MSMNPQDPSAPTHAAPDVAPVVPPVTYAPLQWRPGMTPVELEDFRSLRDLLINGRIARIINERRSGDYEPPKELMINPLGQKARITSLPSESRWHPVMREDIAHTGIDTVPVNYRAGVSLPPPVYAAASGEVIYVGRYSERAGLFVMVLDRDNRIHSYAHLAEGSTGDLKEGDQLQRGEQFAQMGNTGPVDDKGNPLLRPHLHHGVRKLGKQGQLQSAMAQAQQHLPFDFDEKLPDLVRLDDPALDYMKYDVVNPPYEGRVYRSLKAPIPAPSSQYALVPRATAPASMAEEAMPAPTPSAIMMQLPEGSIPALPPGISHDADVFEQAGPGNRFDASGPNPFAPMPRL